MVQSNLKMKKEKTRPKYEEGQVPGSIIIPRKQKLMKLSIFLIIVASLLIIFPLIARLGPWLINPGLKGPYLSWTEDPKTTMTISWQTPEPCDSIVDFALLTSPDFTNTSTNTTTTKYHSITITSLTPNTEYKYRIRTSTLSNFWDLDQSTHTFKTAPNASIPFKFVVYGDVRVGTFTEGVHQRVVNAILREPDFSFVLNVGDIPHRPENLDQWDRFFWEIKELAATKSYMTSLGNHEYDEGDNPDYGANYFKFFHLPQNGKNEFYYSFNYSNVHLTAINMSTSDLVISQEEINWLDNDLNKTVGQNMWNVVFFHVPPYSSGAHGFNQEVIDRMVPIFEKHKVVVFQGHDHHYEHLIVNNIHYITSGGGGAPLELSLRPNPYTQYLEDTYCYTLVSINGDEMTVTTKRPDGSIVDEFLITRTN
jgi:hypothetical protein